MKEISARGEGIATGDPMASDSPTPARTVALNDPWFPVRARKAPFGRSVPSVG